MYIASRKGLNATVVCWFARVFLKRSPTGSGCVQSEWSRHHQEEAEGDEESAGEDGETAGKAWERGQTQRTPARQHWLALLKMMFSAMLSSLHLLSFMFGTLQRQTGTTFFNTHTHTHTSRSKGISVSEYPHIRSTVSNNLCVNTNEAAYENIFTHKYEQNILVHLEVVNLMRKAFTDSTHLWACCLHC